MLLSQIVLSSDGTAAQMISKYRPPCPILVVSDSERVLRGLSGFYGIFPCKVAQLSKDSTAEAVSAGVKAGLAMVRLPAIADLSIANPVVSKVCLVLLELSLESSSACSVIHSVVY